MHFFFYLSPLKYLRHFIFFDNPYQDKKNAASDFFNLLGNLRHEFFRQCHFYNKNVIGFYYQSQIELLQMLHFFTLINFMGRI